MGARVLRSDPRGEYGNAGVKVKHVRRKDFDPENRIVHIRTSKNEMSKRVIPLNDSAFEEVERMIRCADLLGHTEPTHYLWCASQHHQLDPSKPAANWHTAWRALRDARPARSTVSRFAPHGRDAVIGGRRTRSRRRVDHRASLAADARALFAHSTEGKEGSTGSIQERPQR